ncbi:DUF5630 domain-containing protein [Legionella tunisiensis]|uniref:DUF5630 domain-containing protein n=1 Tax=Legionella tunisiensis TaxID=1034944 RepID=UPI000307CBBA|nr:DUF5630 domain-containing protein [Legionella tunisiensis]
MPYQTLQQFLELTPDEKACLKPLLELSTVLEQRSLSTQEEITLASEIEKIEQIDLALLVSAALGNPRLNTLCKHPSLDDFWNELWRLCGLNPSKNGQIPKTTKPIHEYKPQSTLHTFELLKGLCVYGQYKKHLKAERDIHRSYAPAYLQLAAYLGYFPALSGLCKQALARKSMKDALYYASRAAELYWTPGYFLLAITTYTLANQERNAFLYKEALFQLIIAEKLIPHSEAMINNAYQGKSVETALAEIGLSNMSELQSDLAHVADLPLYWVTTVLYKQAEQAVNRLTEAVALTTSNYKVKTESPKKEVPETETSTYFGFGL